ncbi:hypothetical protein EMPS_03881 [Entomortierella parvispora]|uniref:Uncharacterized protein n=1 Tax=Entomortierella parvispora TaxID=205924 RepID=A0A9P3LUV1_9FUNG|nr:hypothetical protein EMPS_03881 [Entomortierella parvispora]
MTSTLQDAPPPIPSPRIPPECIGLVALYLWDDVRTLHALLLCNRSFFSLAAPLLYRSPFHLIDAHLTWSEASKAERTAQLVRLLYLCTLSKQSRDQDSSCSGQLSDVAAITAGFNKMPFLQEDPALEVHPIFNKIPLPLSTDYLFHFTHQGQIPKTYRAFQLLFKSCDKKQSQVAQFAIMADINRRLNFAFVSHFPSRIQVLSVTPSQLGQLLRPESDGDSLGRGIVDDLRMLRRLELDYGASKNPSMQEPSFPSFPRDMRYGRNKKPVLEEVDIPLEFLRQHRTLFVSEEDPSTLVPITVEDEPQKLTARQKHEQQRIEREEDSIPLKEIMIRGSHRTWTPDHLLSQIHPLEVVDLSAWNSDVPHLDQIPTRRLRSLRTNLQRRLDSVNVETSFLQKAHRLEEIWMPCQRPDSLTWAIDLEKSIGPFAGEARKRRRGAGRAAIPVMPTANTDMVAQVDEASGATTSLNEVNETIFAPVIVPSLKKIRLYGVGEDLVQSLEDAADAFRDSIEELTGFEDGSELRDAYIRLTISWLCPRLTILNLRGRFVRYMDLQSLRQFPELRVVRLTIEGSSPRSATSRYNTPSEGAADASDASRRHLPTSSSATASSTLMGADEEESTVEAEPTPLENARRRFSIFTNMKRLEELHLRGPHWNVDDNVLEVLAEPVVPAAVAQAQDSEQHEEATSYLRKNLRLFFIPEEPLPTRVGLTQFAHQMQRLEVLQLGKGYGWMATRLQNDVGPRVKVDINL